MAQGKIKVLIADDDSQLARELAKYAASQGFECRLATGGLEAKRILLEFKPRFVLADLMLPEINAISLGEFMRSEPSLSQAQMDLLVLSEHNDLSNVKQSLARGAKDYIVKPYKCEDVVKRLIFHCRGYRRLQEVPRTDFPRMEESSLVLHLTNLVLRQAMSADSLDSIIFNLTRMVNLKVEGVRCSVVQCLSPIEGVVVSSNDNRGATGIRLDLNQYPEITHVMNTGQPVAIENLDLNEELKSVKSLLKDVMFNALIVCPIQWDSPQGSSSVTEFFGVLSLRLPAQKTSITDHEIRFVEIVAHVISLVLSQRRHQNADFWMAAPLRGPIPFPRRPKKKAMD